jgi:hypothetical protein
MAGSTAVEVCVNRLKLLLRGEPSAVWAGDEAGATSLARGSSVVADKRVHAREEVNWCS